MVSHDLFDRIGGFCCMIERDARGMVVQYMRIDGAVKEIPPDKAKVSVDRRGGAT